MDYNTSSSITLFDFQLLKENENYDNANGLLRYIKSQMIGKSLKVYTDGEFDGNQTLFERMSNHLQIGVKASSKKFGVCLLRLLRCQIDCHHDLDIFWCFLDDEEIKKLLKDEEEISWDKIIDILDGNFNNYVSEFDLNGTAEITLCERKLSGSLSEKGTKRTSGETIKTVIKRPTKDIALWGVDDLLKFVDEAG